MKLPDDLLSQLEDLARTRRVSKSQVVRESLERALREDSTRTLNLRYRVRVPAGYGQANTAGRVRIEAIDIRDRWRRRDLIHQSR